MEEAESNTQPAYEDDEGRPGAEEGELEEGELSDEEEEQSIAPAKEADPQPAGESGGKGSKDGPMDKEKTNIQQRLLEEAGQAPTTGDEQFGGPGGYAFPPQMSGNEGAPSDDDRKHKKRRRKEHRKRKRDAKDKKKKHKAAKYVDHDRVEDDYPMYEEGKLSWPGYGGQKSPPGPYDSPQDSNSDSYDDWDDPRRRGGHVDKYDRPPPGPYDSPYDSPPGAYDTPDDDEYGPPPKLKRMESVEGSGNHSGSRSNSKRSMLSMVGDEYMDANVAANEREEVYDRKKRMPPSASKLRKMEKSRQYKEQQKEREKVLTKGDRKALKSAMDSRPQCRFYMEGKCSKGFDCPFNHGFEPPKKFEVCKFYISDSCTKGRDCLYVHSEFPCRFFHNHGGCDRGDNCKFSHGELTEQTAEWLHQSAGFIAREEERLEAEGLIPPLGNKGGGGSRSRGGHRDEERGSPSKKGSFNNQRDGDSQQQQLPNQASQQQAQQQQGQNQSQPSQDMKKIPSLFEIKTYAPGTAPRPPKAPMNMPQGSQGPQGPGPQGPQGPPGPGPRGPFFNEMNAGGMPPAGLRGPPPPGPGPMMGPIPPGGPRPMGPLLPGPPVPPQGPMMRPPMGPAGPGAPGFYNNFYMDTSGSDTTQGDQSQMASSGDTSQGQAELGGAQSQDPTAAAAGTGAQGTANPNVPFDISHLPPKQRELFMRIQQQQHSNTAMGGAGEQKDEEENWYSDDEEEGHGQDAQKNQGQGMAQGQTQGLMAQNVASLIQSIRHASSAGGMPPQQSSITSQASGGLPQSSQPGASPLNIATMLTAIRQSMGPTGVPQGNSQGNVGSPQDPRSRPADPRKARAAANTTTDMSTPEANLEIKCFGTKVKYALRRITVEGRPSLPHYIIKHDPKYKDDPRVDKYYQPNITPVPRSMSDRHGTGSHAKKKSDPRLQRKGSSESRSNKEKESSMPTTAMGMPLPPLSLSRTASVPSSPSPQSTNKDSVKSSGMGSPTMPAELLSPPPADTKVQRTLSLPLGPAAGGGGSSPGVSGEAPKLPEALQDWNKPQAIHRRTSSEGSGGNISDTPNTPPSTTSPSSLMPSASSASKKLDYRNDPRFKKKKTSTTNLSSGSIDSVPEGRGVSLIGEEAGKSPQEPTMTGDEDQTAAQLSESQDNTGSDDVSLPSYVPPKSRRDQTEFESPLLAQEESSPKDDAYSGYNRPPNENYKKLQEQGSKRGAGGRGRGKGRGGITGILRDSHSPNMDSPGGGGSPGNMPALAPILPEQMEGPPTLTPITGAMGVPMHTGDEPSLKDMFKTIDPTASPFC